ncbi:IS3 family transposase [Arcobacter sp. F155]|uniref:IS3 family transposase n=1 Tax=Arcobacter sp. F155 TaxID=2044512 RepID=UPI00100A29FE|nr:IS3 family transposase [Arcobacter sp. F155]RXJ75186.1 IS3 family transposase [Arcobacter sp. F155]
MARGRGKSFSADFKTKVVLELLEGEQTINQISSKYDVTVKSIQTWKAQFLDNASLAFDVGGATKAYKEEIEELKQENDHLAKALGKATVRADFAEGKLKSLDLSNKKTLINPKHEQLTISEQCKIIGISRSSYYYEPEPLKEQDIKIMHKIDEIYTDVSFYGYRRIHMQLKEYGFNIGVNRVLKYMNTLGIQAIFPRKKRLTSIKNYQHKIYPYLLKDIEITKPNQVWSGDITYIRTAKGFVYLAAVIDWHTKSVLSWKVSNSMDTLLAGTVLKDAIERYGTPGIFNTDQGSQYTSNHHTDILKSHNIKISMNGRGRSIDNIAIERFFRTLKYENIYITDYQSIKELKVGISNYIHFYNYNRFHSALGYDKPMNVYLNQMKNVA